MAKRKVVAKKRKSIAGYPIEEFWALSDQDISWLLDLWGVAIRVVGTGIKRIPASEPYGPGDLSGAKGRWVA